MANMKVLGLLGAGLVIAQWTAPADAAIRTQTIEYRQGETTLQGYLAYDDTIKSKRPGVLVIHEWMGLTDYEQRRARELAQLGYAALAADIYGKGVRPTSREEAAATAGRFRADRQLLRARARAGLDTLRSLPQVNPLRLAAIGYCFGGMAALELARSGADLRGVVDFHGGLETPNPADNRSIKASVLALIGADDPSIPPDQRLAFEQGMRQAGVDWQLVLYAGAVHAFTNQRSGNDPSKGAAYNAKADRRSWQAMRDFLAGMFTVRR